MRVFFPFLLWDYESSPPILWESCNLFRKTGIWKTAVAVNFHPPSLPPPNLQLPSKSGRTSYIFPGTHFHGSHVFCWFFPAEPFCWRFFQGQRLRTHRPLESSVLLRWDITQNSQVEMSVVDFEYGLVPWMVLEMNVPCRKPRAEGHAVHDGSFGWSGSPKFRSAHLRA